MNFNLRKSSYAIVATSLSEIINILRKELSCDVLFCCANCLLVINHILFSLSLCLIPYDLDSMYCMSHINLIQSHILWIIHARIIFILICSYLMMHLIFDKHVPISLDEYKISLSIILFSTVNSSFGLLHDLNYKKCEEYSHIAPHYHSGVVESSSLSFLRSLGYSEGSSNEKFTNYLLQKIFTASYAVEECHGCSLTI